MHWLMQEPTPLHYGNKSEIKYSGKGHFLYAYKKINPAAAGFIFLSWLYGSLTV